MEFHGRPIRQGDMVVFPLSTAGRDEHAYADAKTFELNRGVYGLDTLPLTWASTARTA
jgi:cytochrome P450